MFGKGSYSFNSVIIASFEGAKIRRRACLNQDLQDFKRAPTSRTNRIFMHDCHPPVKSVQRVGVGALDFCVKTKSKARLARA
ncbi:hypothetical protein O71_07514 [Pontibacter sp. BAB1700]|nr:hypothetical protein O71_07514 [Pontibacter sp. BAB1700]